MTSQPQDAIAEIRKRHEAAETDTRPIIERNGRVEDWDTRHSVQAHKDRATLLGEVLRLKEAKRAWDIAIEETLARAESAEARAAAIAGCEPFPKGKLFCRVCDDGQTQAVTIMYFDEGCVCAPDRLQALCAQHAIKAEPLGTKEFVAGLDPWELRDEH